MATPQIDLDSPSIRALGSLFKLTEVYLQDDNISSDNDHRVSSFPKHIRFKYDDDDDDDGDDNDDGGKISSSTSLETSDGSIVMENAELTEEMSALGLPLSFRTSKQIGETKGKSKGTQRKNQHNQKSSDDQVQGSDKVSEENLCDDMIMLFNSQDKSSGSSSISLPDKSENSCSKSDISDDMNQLSDCHEGEKLAETEAEPSCGLSEDLATETVHSALDIINDSVNANMTRKTQNDDLLEPDSKMDVETMSIATTSNLCTGSTLAQSHVLDQRFEQSHYEMDTSFTEQGDTERSDIRSSNIIRQIPDTDLSKESQNTAGLNIECSGTSGDWSAFWDSYYMRYYFYNAKTKESTWEPPPGMEYFAFGDISCIPSESNVEVPWINADPSVSACEDKQLEISELVDKSGSDEQTEGRLSGHELTANDFSSGLGSLLGIVENCHSLSKESEQVVSVNTSNDGLLSKDFDSTNLPGSFVSHCEDSSKNCDGNVIVEQSNSSSFTTAAQAAGEDDSINLTQGETIDNDLDMQDVPVIAKRKKKRRNRTRKKSFNDNDNNDGELQPVEEFYVDITKYWRQRYLLFSRFDHGIQMDEEGWFSVTPEAIAKHQASRCGGRVIIDCFAGVGGNVIQFAKTGKHVVAIDIDSTKIDYAHQNAAIYGVEDRIDFVRGDSLSLAPKLKADTIFLSPPWGGPDYVKLDSYDINMLQPYDGQLLFNTFKEICSMIIMFLPRNVDVVQLAELSLSSNPPWSLEVEKNFLNDKLKALTAYFSKPSVQKDD